MCFFVFVKPIVMVTIGFFFVCHACYVPVRRSLKPSAEYRQLRLVYNQDSVLNNKQLRILKTEFSYLYMTQAASQRLSFSLCQTSLSLFFSLHLVRRSLKPSDEYRQLRRVYIQDSVLNNNQIR